MRKKTKAAAAAANRDAGIVCSLFTFPEWCASRKFSESTGRNLRKAGLGPEIFDVGRLVFITPEADAKWFVMWTKQRGKEKFKQWQREQREKREQRKQQQSAQAA